MTVKVRFAPSPTGYLHVGNMRTALVNWLFARKAGGQFLLRIDDTDRERSKPEYTESIRQDMRWLGLVWDAEEFQSKRFERYHAAAEALRAQGRLYACYESPEELDVQRKMLASRGLPPIYKRATDEQSKKYVAEGRAPHFRFALNDEEIVWNDLIRGEVRFKATHMSDPVLLREDGVPVYTLASVVDDGELGVTHVIRGEDHVSNTAVQVQLYKALGFALPTFAHMALLKTRDGEMSKRLGGNDIRSLREAGIEPMAINSLLAKIGTSDPIEHFADLKALIDSFDISRFGRAPATYDAADLQRLNEKLLTFMSFDIAKPRLAELGLTEADETFWHSIRPNIRTMLQATEWWDILNGKVSAQLSHDDAVYVRSTIDKLPPEPWNEETSDRWLDAIGKATGRKGKELFMPVRMALTGRQRGPELKALLPLLGRVKVVQRLSA